MTMIFVNHYGRPVHVWLERDVSKFDADADEAVAQNTAMCDIDVQAANSRPTTDENKAPLVSAHRAGLESLADVLTFGSVCENCRDALQRHYNVSPETLTDDTSDERERDSDGSDQQRDGADDERVSLTDEPPEFGDLFDVDDETGDLSGVSR